MQCMQNPKSFVPAWTYGLYVRCTSQKDSTPGNSADPAGWDRRIISDDAWDPPRGRASWDVTLANACGAFSTLTDLDDYPGMIETRRLGDFSCARISTTARAFRRGGAEIARDNRHFGYLVLQLAGRSRVEQGGRDCRLETGEVTVIDSRVASALDFTGKTLLIIVPIPEEVLDAQCGQWRALAARRLNRIQGNLIASLVQAEFEHDAAHSVRGEIVCDAILRLLRLCDPWEDSGAGQGAGSLVADDDDQLRSLKDYMLQNLSDYTLEPKSIAQRFNMSERNLHRIFSAGGLSLCRWVRQTRLSRCAAELRNPALRRDSVTTIAYRWGFNDSAYFSRIFREEFGTGPRAYRTAALPARAHRRLDQPSRSVLAMG